MSPAPAPPAVEPGMGGGPRPDMSADLPRLFDPDAPTCRSTDPATSRSYGRGDPSRNRQCFGILEVIARQAGHGATCAEVVSALRWDRANTARRVKDLRDRGCIETSPHQRMSGAGKPQHIHYVTEHGRSELERARRVWAVAS